jgi:hypothetical protein
VPAFLWAEPDQVAPVSRYWTRSLRPSERNNRFELIAAAEAYWRANETQGTPDYVRAPLLPDTVRYENGRQLTLTAGGPPGSYTAMEQMDRGILQHFVIADRRYPVVDEETGCVLCLARLGDPTLNPPGPWLDGVPPSPAAFVSEMFAVVQGKIVEIDAIFTGTKEQLPTPWPVGFVPTRNR